MVYMGSKNRIAKELIPIITKDLKPNQWYCEPFVGGANMIDKIEHPYKLGADNNKYLIALLEAVQNGQELPEHITKDEYIAVRQIRIIIQIGMLVLSALYVALELSSLVAILAITQQKLVYKETILRNVLVTYLNRIQMESNQYVVLMMLQIFQLIALYTVTHLITVLQSTKKALILMLFGNGVEIKPKKDIQYMYLNIMRQKTLNVFGKSR